MRACTWSTIRISCEGRSKSLSGIWTLAHSSASIARSLLISNVVRGLELQESGEYEVVLDSKIRLKLSRRFRKRFQDRLDELSSGR